MVGIKPTHVLMLGIVNGPGCDGAGEAFHHEMECLVVMLDGAERLQVANGDMEFLLDFADAGLLAGLVGFELSAGELPAVLELSVSALGRKEFLAIADYGCRYVDRFHLIAPFCD